jgi:hexosaminidase
MKKLILSVICILLATFFSGGSLWGQEFSSLIPYPLKLTKGEGHFVLSPETRLIVNDEGKLGDAVTYLQQMVASLMNKGLVQMREDIENGQRNAISINISNEQMPTEAYRLEVTPRLIRLSASHPQGMFYALQTLHQLLWDAQVSSTTTKFNIPCLSIADQPAFEWRGLMLDVSRHFYSMEFLKKQVDILSSFKMNRLHLHLTDDQGWRLEIKAYPALTQRGAWRTFNRQDSTFLRLSKVNPEVALDPRFIIRHDEKTLYGGFYTQEEIRDLVQYAQKHHVEIVPEIDMPGHMMAAISLFPELSCTGAVGWGETFSYPLCPCNEATFTFLENILTEVIDLFPSRYIHIGVDEVEKNTWEASEACKQLMQKNGYKEVRQLQTYFTERIRSFIASKGKEVIAWDEVLEDKINADTNIMFWRDWIGGVPEKATANGNKVIFTPTSPMYFSRRDSSLYAVYHFTSQMDAIPDNKQSLILGAQASIWAEGIPNEQVANRLIYPRLIALSEAVWTPREMQNWHSFKFRLGNQFRFLDKQNVRHTQPSYRLLPLMHVNKEKKEINIRLESERVEPVIYYTTDGSTPTLKSHRYTDQGITVTKSADVCAAIFDKGVMQLPNAHRLADYHKAIGKSVVYNNPWNKAYPAGMEYTMTDGYRGGEQYNDGFWQGFTTDIDIIIDLGEPTVVSSFSAQFMQVTGTGLYMPQYVEYSISLNGNTYETILNVANDIPENEKKAVFKNFEGKIKQKKARYVKVFAKNKSGGFIFTDEIVIN